jgi:hypothetical protein
MGHAREEDAEDPWVTSLVRAPTRARAEDLRHRRIMTKPVAPWPLPPSPPPRPRSDVVSRWLVKFQPALERLDVRPYNTRFVNMWPGDGSALDLSGEIA